MYINVWNEKSMRIKMSVIFGGSGSTMRKFNFVICTFIGGIFTLCKNYLYDTKIKAVMDIFWCVAPNSLTSCFCEETSSRIIPLVFLLTPPYVKRDNISVGDVREKRSKLRSVSVTSFFWVCLPGKRPWWSACCHVACSSYGSWSSQLCNCLCVSLFH